MRAKKRLGGRFRILRPEELAPVDRFPQQRNLLGAVSAQVASATIRIDGPDIERKRLAGAFSPLEWVVASRRR